MRCPICTAENPEGQKFCGDCGSLLWPEQSIQTARSTTSGHGVRWAASHWKALVSIVVAVALLIVAIVAIVALDPFAPSYSGTLKLSVVNYNDGPRSCSVFIDGHFARNETVNGGVGAPTYAPGSEILTIKVSWKEAATHQCSIEVFSSGTRYVTSVWIADGLTVSAHFRIGYGFF